MFPSPFASTPTHQNSQFAIFIDDFNMPKRETYGAQPPIELMRQMVDMGGWYDRKAFRMKRIVDVALIGAMGPPGGGRDAQSVRRAEVGCSGESQGEG